jgi:GNAT superfamily N-acetyltransferase
MRWELSVDRKHPMSENIRRALPADSADITDMIHGLAEFERGADQCAVTETQISTALFGNYPTVHGHVAEVDGEIAAMALWFLSFSTWDGVAGIYLEDLFVRPRFRRRGLARALLAALAAECVDSGYTRLSWAVLNWNSDAIALYDGIGGEPLREWTTYRLSGPRLAELAGPR